MAQFSEVILAVRQLPRLDATEEVAELMAEAADAEDLALRKLRATFQKSSDEETTPSASDVLDPELSSSGSGSFVADDPSLSSVYESQVSEQ